MMTWGSLLQIFKKGINLKSPTLLLSLWKCSATALPFVLFITSLRCSPSLSDTYLLHLPRYWILGSLLLHTRYKNPRVLQSILPFMGIFSPVLYIVTSLTISAGLEVIMEHAVQPPLLFPLLHRTTPFLYCSPSVLVAILFFIGGSLALHSNSLMFVPLLKVGLGTFGK